MTTEPVMATQPRDWSEIRVGHMVLAKDGEDGWYEARVIAVVGEMLTLEWRDYPEEGEVIRHRSKVALLPL
jgi:hypothetical protein